MKKQTAWMGACAILVAGLTLCACSKKESSPGATPQAAAPAATEGAKAVDLNAPGAGGLTPQQIADTISKSVCKRMPTCNPGGGSETDCVTGMSKDMGSSLSDKAKAVTQAQLDTCTAAIAKATCEVLSGDNPPAGCEFMN